METHEIKCISCNKTMFIVDFETTLFGKRYKKCVECRAKCSEYMRDHREKYSELKKKYVEENRDDILKYHKQYNNEYYELKKDELMARTKCDCGGSYNKTTKARHFKTKRHLKYEC